ncbi:hypothetical protein V7793_10505 [Streptomyces sp. KLMMK]|uniref:hypothetical protein n=1 Tax=Streptomyces sp. KLMMK TaxID=3109353 RepID=UPI00300B25DD
MSRIKGQGPFDYTHQCYRAAFGRVNERFWIGAEETERRRRALDEVYASIGVSERGRKVSIPAISALAAA